MNPEPDWYVDPFDDTQWRYWDGQQWTMYRAPRHAGPAVVQTQPPIDSRGRRSSSGLVWALVIGLPILGFGMVVVAVVAFSGNPARDRPPSQTEFLEAVAQHRDKGGSGGNDVKVKRALEERGDALCEVLDSGRFSGWRGEVTGIHSAGDKVGLTVDVGEDVEVGTWNNRISDLGDGTLLEPSSRLYEVIAQVEEGDVLEVSGTFITDSDTCIRESSLTDSGSLTTPDFVAMFTDIQAVG